MRIAIHECEHCGEEYHFQWSGNYDALEIPKEHRDEKFCPTCKKAVYEALIQIPVKYEYRFVSTNEVSLEELLRWEQENKEAHSGFPLAIRVFASLMDRDTGEMEVTREVIGRGDKKGRIYIYSYFPSKPEECRIVVKRRVNLETNEQGKYFKK